MVTKKGFEPDYSGEIENVFRKYGFECSCVSAVRGPVYTRYILSPEAGTKVSSVLKKAEAIASQMPVEKVRIVAPINEMASIGVEVPDTVRDTVRFEEMLPSLNESGFRLPVALGRTVEGNDYLIDLADAPHILAAGIPESGKTMLLHSIICSLVCTMNPEGLRFVIAQPGHGMLEVYNGLENLDRPVAVSAEDALDMLEDVAAEAERRVRLFSENGFSRIDDYNMKSSEKLPRLVVMIDEFSDVVRLAPDRFDSLIKRLTAVGRFIGIHIVLTTRQISAQTISADVWANMTTLIALQMPDRLSSRFVLGYAGGEKLLGQGDMLYFRNGMNQPLRLQGVLCRPEKTRENT